MRRIVYGILIALLGSQVLLSCTVEHISNGALDGFWHFEQIDTLATGGTLDLRAQTLFWGFDAGLMHTQGATNKFYFRFSYEGSTLILYSPYLDHGHQDQDDGGDIPLDDATLLHPYGIQNLTDTFLIEQLTGSRMTLSTAQHRLFFTRF